MRNVVLTVLFLATCLGVCGAEEVAAPQAFQAEKIECHGKLHGKEFWLRLMPADKRYNGLRVLELLYTPSSSEELNGCHLIDHPQILLNDQLEIIAWKEGRGVHQSGLSAVLYQAQMHTYDVVLEKSDEAGEIVQEPKKITAMDAAWDQRILPLLMCLVKPDQDFEQEVYDFYGASKKQVLLKRSGKTLSLGAATMQLVYDDAGRLSRILGPKDKVILHLDGWR